MLLGGARGLQRCHSQAEPNKETCYTATAMQELFSVGHSNGTVERLVALLRAHQIAVLCDVRSVPYSRYTPQFNREALAEVLPSFAITYHWFGDRLGGLQQTDRIAFHTGLDQLVGLGALAPTVFMCAEADYHGCHRHRLITPALIECGVGVWHILGDGSREAGRIEPQQMRMFE